MSLGCQVERQLLALLISSLLVFSAGVGRTGVFIALTNLIERLKTEAVVDVYQAVKRLRQQRTAMVQTKVGRLRITGMQCF